MTIRRDMSGVGFQRALKNQGFTADYGVPFYRSTRDDTDKRISYGAILTAKGLHRRETIRHIIQARNKHEADLKRKALDAILPW